MWGGDVLVKTREVAVGVVEAVNRWEYVPTICTSKSESPTLQLKVSS